MYTTIQEIFKKIKGMPNILNRRDDIFISLIIILVGLGSFGLGRLSVMGEGRVAPYIENTILDNSTALSGAVSEALMSLGGEYVGSIKGSKYHAPWCSGAKRIKEENKIWFSSKKEAETAGYTPAANCKGI